MDNCYYKAVVAEVSNRVRELLHSKQFILIGIDGCGGSGKSTFANELSDSLFSAPIVRMDDFYKLSQERSHDTASHSIGWQFDWRRLENEVLKPLTQKGSAKYQRYNWNSDCLTEIQTIQPESPIIVEGIYTLRPELLLYYNLHLWIECSKEIRLQRGIERDGEQARLQWEDDWMKEEDRYVSTCSPYLHAEIIVDGMPA